MRKIYKIAGIMLVAGVLAAGIGSGVAFAEYSAFEYGGEAFLEGSERFTKTLQYKVSSNKESTLENEKEEDTTEAAYEEDQSGKLVDENGQQKEDEATEAVSENELLPKKELDISIPYRYTIVQDSSVPKNVVQIAVSYLSDNQDVEPEIIVENSDAAKEEIYLECNFRYEDFRNLMRIKGPILSDLKSHKISDYQMDGVEIVEFRVNPEAEFDMHINGY